MILIYKIYFVCQWQKEKSLEASGASVGQIDNAISGSIGGVQNGSENPMGELNSNLESSFANFKAENKQSNKADRNPSGGNTEDS